MWSVTCTGGNSVVCRNRNPVRSVYFQSTNNYDNELMELDRTKKLLFEKQIKITHVDLLYIWQTDTHLKKLRWTVC